MKLILIFFASILCSCSNLKTSIPEKVESSSKKTKVRVTFYSKGEDKWGNKIASCSKKRAKKGITAAGDPKIFPYGTIISFKHPSILKIFKDPYFIVQDTGTAVKAKKASNGKTPVIDLYVDSKSEMRKIQHEIPHYLYLEVVNQ